MPDTDADRWGVRQLRRETQLAELRALLGSDPELQARYEAAVRGEIPGGEVLTMAVKETPVSLRLPAELIARADALVDPMGEDLTLATVTGGRVTRSTVLRVALLRGLQALERDFDAEPEGER